MSFIMSLDIEDFIELVEKAMEEDMRDRLWEKWLVDYSRMSGDNFISFEEYVKDHKKPSEDNRTEEEVLEDTHNILYGMATPQEMG